MAQRSNNKVVTTVDEAKARALALAAGIDHDIHRGFTRRKWLYLGGAAATGLALGVLSSRRPRREKPRGFFARWRARG